MSLRSKHMSKDLMNDRHLCHASDADQAAELLTRWQQDGVGKLAGEIYLALLSSYSVPYRTCMGHSNQRSGKSSSKGTGHRSSPC